MDENIQTIKIDPDGKYVIVLEFNGIHALTYEYVDRISRTMNEWWKTQEKFFVVFNNKEDGTTIRFERLEKDG